MQKSEQKSEQTSESDNKGIIRLLVEAGNKLDRDTQAAHIAPDAVIHTLYEATDTITHELAGHEEVFSIEKMEERIAYDQKMFSGELQTVDHMFDVEGDMVLTISTISSTHKSGKRVTTQSIGLEKIADGKIVEGWYLGDRLGFWQQLGLVPPTSELQKQLEAM